MITEMLESVKDLSDGEKLNSDLYQGL